MKNAIFTAISTSDYLQGVLALNESLKKCTAMQLWVLCPEQIAVLYHDIFEQKNIKVFAINEKTDKENTAPKYPDGEYSYWQYSFIKLHLFQLTDFHKILYIDADIMVVNDVSKLFEREGFWAVSDSEFMQNDSLQGINSGLMLIEPDLNVYNTLMIIKEELVKSGKTIGDQDVISTAISRGVIRSNPLEKSYNCCAYLLDRYEERTMSELKAVHFISANKPWKWSGIYAFLRIKSYLLRGRLLTWKYTKKYYQMCKNVIK